MTDTAPPAIERAEKCPLCEEIEAAELFETHDWLYNLPGSFLVVRCVRCGVMYLRTRPTPQSLSSYYPDEMYYSYKRPAPHSLFGHGNTLARMWYLVKRSVLAHEFGYVHLGGSRIAAWIARLPPLHMRATFRLGPMLHPWVKDGALLEVGCGAGMYLDLMRALGWERTLGVDVSKAAVAQAHKVLGLEAYSGELWDVRLPSASFDAVSLAHTLEHVSEPMRLLLEIWRILKPGGRFAIVVPNAVSLCSRQYGELWWHLDPPRHMVNYSPATLAFALDQGGFQIERITTTARGAYHVALYSYCRRVGDPHTVYTDPSHRFSLRRKVRARATVAAERVLCVAGAQLGEEILAVARKPAR